MAYPENIGTDPVEGGGGGGIGSGSRRYLTVLFSDLSESTRLGTTMEAEHYAMLIGSVRRLWREIIPRHGGRIARIQGDGVLAVFGLPVAGEDDGRCATEAALELHDAVGALRSGTGECLTLHSGIHAGLVYVLEGDLERGRFEVLGDVPNLASRISALASAGEIVVSEETLGPGAHFFAMSPRERVHLKGFGAPVAIQRVLGRATVRRRIDASALRGSAPFAGRSAESHALAALLLADAGAPVCVAIAGGPGIGKTRFLEEALRHAAASNWLVLRGYCENYLGATPLQPFVQVIGALQTIEEAAALAPLDHPRNALGRLLGSALPSVIEAVAPALEAARSGRLAPVQAITNLCDQLAAEQPLLLLLDDWQWADDASRRTLDALMALDRRILVLLGTREVGAEALTANTRVIELLPLAGTDAARTIEFLLPGADPFRVAEIHLYAGGNPLFIEELCHAARTDTVGSALGRRHGGTAWLHSLIESRVARLPPGPAQLVRIAAVIGNIVPVWLLQRLTGRRGDDPLVRSLAEHDFVFPTDQPGMLRFKHGITRDVVYGTVGLQERERLHGRIGAALVVESASSPVGELLELLAYHCAAGGLFEEAARYAEQAGDKAIASFALDRAQAQYLAALRALDHPAPATAAQRLRWCGIAQKLGMASVFDALSLTDGVRIFERNVELAAGLNDRSVLARAEYWLCYIHYAKGSAREAIRHGRLALDLCQRLDDAALAAQVRAALGQALAAAADYDEALPLLDSAIDTKRAKARVGGSVAVGSAYALVCKGAVLGDQGAFALAEECFVDALALLGATVHQVASSVRNWISAVYLWQGRWEDARAMATTSVRIAEQVKSRQLLSMSRALGGYAEWVQTHDTLALQAVRSATHWVESRNGALLSSLSGAWLADAAATCGEHAEARRAAARVFARTRVGDLFGEPMACRALARCAEAACDAPRADRYLERAMASAQARRAAHEIAVTQLCRAEIEVGRERRGEAVRWLDPASRAFDAMAMHWHLRRATALRDRL